MPQGRVQQLQFQYSGFFHGCILPFYGPRNPGHRPGAKEANSGYLLYFGTSHVRIKGKMTVARTRNYRIPGIILPLLRWTGGTIYVECPVDILYYEPDSSFRESL